MLKIRIQFVSKSGSLYGGDPVIIETDYVPRIGEIITTNPSTHPYDLEGGSFMVQSVVSELTDEGLVPHITARQWYKGFREEMLAERGWLTSPEGTDIVHDEDDLLFPG